MNDPVVNVVFGTKDWANDLLGWFTKEILYAGTDRIQNKVIVALEVEDTLRSQGYWWQAERVLDNLHKYLKDLETP